MIEAFWGRIQSNFVVYTITAIVCLMMIACDGYAILTVGHFPHTVIKDESSKLHHPEGIAFSPTGDYVVTANLFSNSVTFYKRIGDQGSVYETTPAFSIKGKKSKLDYPHDVAFSRDGSHFAVANRRGNSITIYAKNDIKGFYNTVPVAVIRGESSQIAAPSSVRYSPVDNVIAVANTGSHTITFYRYNGAIYDQTPCQMIQGAPNVLSMVNGLDFSVDGELLAAIIIDTQSLLIYQRTSDSENLYSSQPVQIIQGSNTNFCCPHSVSFHSSKNYLVVSNAEGRKNINIFQKLSDGFPSYSSIPVFTLEVTEMYEESTIHLIEQLRKRGGCKGAVFSPDGTSLAITQNLTEPFSVNMLLIYPVVEN